MATMTLELSDEINSFLTDISVDYGITKAEAMKRAFALLVIADQSQRNGLSLGVVNQMPNGQLTPVKRIIGVFNK